MTTLCFSCLFYKYIYTPMLKLILTYYGANIGKKVFFEGKIKIQFDSNLKNLNIGDNVVFLGDNFLKLRDTSTIILQNNVRISNGVQLISANNKTLDIGEYSIVGPYSNFSAGEDLFIGKYCNFAQNVNIHCSDHVFKKDKYISKQGFKHAHIFIGDDCLISANCTIVKGAHIETGCVIGANSLVRGNLKQYGVYAGIPVSIIKERV